MTYSLCLILMIIFSCIPLFISYCLIFSIYYNDINCVYSSTFIYILNILGLIIMFSLVCMKNDETMNVQKLLFPKLIIGFTILFILLGIIQTVYFIHFFIINSEIIQTLSVLCLFNIIVCELYFFATFLILTIFGIKFFCIFNHNLTHNDNENPLLSQNNIV